METLQKDERLQSVNRSVYSIGYYLLLAGIFAVLFFRWFILGQDYRETADFLIVGIVGVLFTFIFSALRGIPPHYPVVLSRSESRFFMVGTPLFSGVVAVLLLFLRVDTPSSRQLVISFVTATVSVSLLLVLYHFLMRYWEKKNLDDTSEDSHST